MKVLLTGAFGNVGTHTIENLLDQGHRVGCFDLETRANKRRAGRFRNRVEIFWGDIRDPDRLAAAVRGQDVVIHMAFVTDVPRSENDPDWARAINVGGTQYLLEVMKNHAGAERIIFGSSISVFGNTQHLRPPRATSDPVNPVGVYPRQKVECEEMVRNSGLQWCILRFAFAPPLRTDRFDPMIFGIEPDSRMEFVDPRDLGLAVANAVSSTEVWGKVLLLGGGPGCQLHYRDFIQRIMEAAGIGRLPDRAFVAAPSSPIDWLDTAESQRILHYQKHSFEDFLRGMSASMGVSRYLIRLFAPLIRRWMVNQSPYFRQAKKA